MKKNFILHHNNNTDTISTLKEKYLHSRRHSAEITNHGRSLLRTILRRIQPTRTSGPQAVRKSGPRVVRPRVVPRSGPRAQRGPRAERSLGPREPLAGLLGLGARSEGKKVGLIFLIFFSGTELYGKIVKLVSYEVIIHTAKIYIIGNGAM